MRQFLTVLKFEYLNYAKNKVFIISTLFLVLVSAAVLSYPRIQDIFKSDAEPQTSTGEKKVIMLVDKVSKDNTAKNSTLKMFEAVLPQNKFELSDKSDDELKNEVNSDKIFAAVVIENQLKYKFITKSIGMYDSTKQTIDGLMQAKYRFDTLIGLGISQNDASNIVTVNIDSQLIETGKNQMQSFFYTYILIFMLYMAILLYGQFVATSVAAEKGSRAMELLITSAKPVNLMFGKVIGSGLAGLVQMVIILSSGFIFYNLNKSYFVSNMVVKSIFGMPVEILLFTVVFFVLGYFIYSFMYGALGSLASRTEDVNTSIMPVTFTFIIAFFVVMFSMGSGKVDSTLMVICSYIPLTSPMAMFVRIAMGNVKTIEIIISIVILIGSTVGIGYISAGIYRMGVLLYGKPPKINEIIKALKAAK